MRSYLFAMLCLTHVTCALSQTLSPADVGVGVGVAKHSCIAPPLPRNAQKMAGADVVKFVGQLDTYTTCIQTYSRDQKMIAFKYQKAAQAALAAADAAIREYNDFVESAEKIAGRN